MSIEDDQIEQLIPHRGVMRFVRRVVERREDGLVCEGSIPAGNPLVDDGRAPVVLGVELAAQGAALLAGLEAAGDGAAAPEIGYLVSLRGVAFEVPSLPADQPLHADVRPAGAAGPLAMYEATVRGPDGRELVRATLGTFRVSGAGGPGRG